MRIITAKIVFLLLTGLFAFELSSYSQAKFVNKEVFLEAESYFEHEEFNEALPLYIQLKEKEPQNYNLDYRIGRCYLSSPSLKTKAIAHLEKATNHISSEYKEGKYTELNAPPDALFYLGDAYRINNQIDKAIFTYKAFKSKVNAATYDIAFIDHQIESCKNAIAAQKKPIDIDIQNPGNAINTRYSDINPVVSANENVIVYISKLPFYDALFYAKKVDGKWSTPVNMMPELEVDEDCYPVCISYDGNELFLYRSDNYRGDLYVSKYNGSKWSKLQKLNTNINTKYWESHASLSRDGKKLYFTSNREGGFGGLDVYISERTEGNNWGPAINLGATINSPYNEDTPFVLADDKRLYFSSLGHATIGGYDIFYSDKNQNGVWSKPKNIGYPLNTTDDDMFFCPVLDGSVGYLAKYDANGQGKYDIVRLNVYTYDNPRKYTISGNVKLPVNVLQNSNFYIALYDKNKKDTVLRKKITGNKISFQAIPGQYEVHIYSNNYEHQKKDLLITWGSKDLERNINFDLLPQIALSINKKETDNSVPDKKSRTISNNDSVRIANENRNDSLQASKKTNTDIINSQTEVDSVLVDTLPETTLINSEDSINTRSDTNFGTYKHWFGNNWVLFTGAGIIPLFLILWLLLIKRRKKNKK